MTENSEHSHELIKQNLELTLIITFIGLAFGLVGLIVRTAEIMSVVVISVGVIVGFVSYHDAFSKPAPSEPVNADQVTYSTSLQSEPTEPEPEPTREPLPRLPRVQRLPSAEEVAAPLKPETSITDTKPTAPEESSETEQVTKNKPRKPRARKIIEPAQVGEKKKV